MAIYLAYLFEAESIQRYIFATGKLRDVSGASELVADMAYELIGDEGKKLSPDQLAEWPRGLVDAAHAQLESLRAGYANTPVNVTWLRHAGGVFSISLADPPAGFLENFRNQWRMFVAQQLSGISFKDGIGSGDSLISAGAAARRALINCPPFPILAGPPANPLMRPASRTGSPAVRATGKTDGNMHTCKIVKGEYVDAATIASRWFLVGEEKRKLRPILPGLFTGFDPEIETIWPVILAQDEDGDEDTIPEPSLFENVRKAELDRRTLAVVHIDGNGFGALFAKAGELDHGRQSAPFLTKQLSESLNKAFVLAARHAVRRVILPECHEFDADFGGGRGTRKMRVPPARPVLLGGDDLTILIRGDLALLFVREFADEFEKQSEDVLKFLEIEFKKEIEDLRSSIETETGANHLTVKAGVAIMGARQPFYRGYRLAETLSKVAGNDGKDKSRVAFWRVTGAAIPETVQDIVESLAKSQLGGSIWRSSWPIIGKGTQSGTLQDIFSLKEQLHDVDVAGSALREVAGIWRVDLQEGEQRFQRALSSLKQRSSEVSAEDLLDSIRAAQGGEIGYTPLMDAHVLRQVEMMTQCHTP